MAYSNPIIEIGFLLTVAVMWLMIFYQLFFSFLGFVHRVRALRERDRLNSAEPPELPSVSILIPAHNEELVIEATIQSLLALDYPCDKIEFIVVNDGSTDKTADLVERAAKADPRVRLFNVPPEEAARGKAHALNLGARCVTGELIAIYDADNRPEPDSLRQLVLNLLDDGRLAAAFGKFRTLNRHRNLLTRFINLETMAFQFIVQAGRHLLFRLAILPGTNLVIRRTAWLEAGGWDEQALTEDTELSIRLYAMGHEIKFVPYAVTWEEEPETWGTWLRQRTRWVRGNFYVLRKHLLPAFRFGKISLIVELLQLFVLYYVFLGAILLSHVYFIGSVMGWIAVQSPGPYFAVWVCACLLFVAEIMLAAAYEGEESPANIAVAFLMYFTYCQAWVVLVFRALYQQRTQKGLTWEKTRRFASAEVPKQ
ncbi:MAG: glycosyltransferase family 2 protein [Candidatus Sumerlaeia bacterium]